MEKHYRDEILNDIIDMDACHMLLGRPWHYDMDATYKRRANAFMFEWYGKEIILTPQKSIEPHKKD